MRKMLRIPGCIILVLASCYGCYRGVPLFFASGGEYCDANGRIYQMVLANHEAWRRQILNDNGRGFVLQPEDHKPLSITIHKNQGRQPYLIVLTGESARGRRPWGQYGQYGYIYTLDGDIATFPAPEEYDLERLSENVYCYRIK